VAVATGDSYGFHKQRTQAACWRASGLLLASAAVTIHPHGSEVSRMQDRLLSVRWTQWVE